MIIIGYIYFVNKITEFFKKGFSFFKNFYIDKLTDVSVETT